MPKGHRTLCPVFKAAHHSVMRKNAAKDVAEKRTKYERVKESSSSSNSSSPDSTESVSPPKGREM